MKQDNIYMQRCIELAQLGIRDVYPNPMVGAVIVHEGKVIGEGYHQHYGEAHAEVNAVNSVRDKSILKEATIYVSLEPCAHHGKTPPCADLLVKHQFKKVVIGCKDTFSEVAGKGIKRLEENGIEVLVGVLENKCRVLNKRFFTFHENKRPYVILKWAETQDGFIDKIRTDNTQEINWITQPETKTLVHQWRSEEQAILIGSTTALNDNPSLTVRNVKGKNPIRILIDRSLKVNSKTAIFNSESTTIILNELKNEELGNLKYIQLSDFSAKSILDTLYKENIQSVIIEGGTKTIQHFIDENLWDEARVLVGKTTFNEGIKAPELTIRPKSHAKFYGDTIYHYQNNTEKIQ
jgi:diaminohydroxyphosphoribosylaminopyrimidine deaminase/5-amino-6-(5-phosphoribosylamino)uracil reductase